MLSLWAILLATTLGLLISVETTQVHAAQKTDVSVEVAESCTIASSGHMHIGTLSPATFQNIGEDTSFDVTCNDKEGYVIYAVGISGDKEGTTEMIGSGDNIIATGTAQEGRLANWSFKLSNPSEGMAIQPGFDNYSMIPTSKTAVIKRMATTQETGVDHFNATYGVYVATDTPADTYEGKVLYTLFHPNTAESDGTVPPKTMQEFGNYCDSMATDQIMTLTDKRDGNSYQVAKLKDGKCWMVENLRIKDKDITSEDSNVSSPFSIPPSDISAFKSGGTSNVTDRAVYVDSYGGIYNWYTATAGTGDASFDTEGSQAPGSICPKGWRLPTGSYNSELNNLITVYGGDNSEGSSNLRANPIPRFTYAGYVNYGDNSLYDQGEYGYYWSSTVHDRTRAHFLRIGDSFANAIDYGYRASGVSVRCIAQ